jgi:hypothetical protein
MIPNIQTTPLNSKTFKIFALFGLLIFASAETSRWLGVEGLPMSIIWPASGLMLGAGVILGYPIVLFSAAVLAVWLLTLQGASVATALFLATAQALGVVAALMYLRRNAGSQTALQLETRSGWCICGLARCRPQSLPALALLAWCWRVRSCRIPPMIFSWCTGCWKR